MIKHILFVLFFSVTLHACSSAPASKPVITPEIMAVSNSIASQVNSKWREHRPKFTSNLSAFISISTTRSGAVTDLQIKTTSGDPEFDKLALQSVRESAPFPAIAKVTDKTYEQVFKKFMFQFKPDTNE